MNRATLSVDPTGMLDIPTVVAKFNSFAKAKTILQEAKKVFPNKGLYITQFDPGTIVLNPEGYIQISGDNKEAGIYLRSNLPIDVAVGVLLFEVIRARHDGDVRKISAEAAAGKVSRADYGTRLEKLSYKYIGLHAAIATEAVQKKIWAPQANRLAGVYKSEQHYLKSADVAADPTQPDETHTGVYRKYWDILFKKAWEDAQKKKGKAQHGQSPSPGSLWRLSIACLPTVPRPEAWPGNGSVPFVDLLPPTKLDDMYQY